MPQHRPRARVGSHVVTILLTLAAVAPAARLWGQTTQHAISGRETVKRCPVLIVTGEDYPGHKWKLTTPVLKRQLSADPRLAVDVAEDLNVLRSPKLRQYRAIVMHFKNYDPAVPGPEGLRNLARFVREGGGLVLVHFACGAFQEQKDEFVKLAGRVWDPKLRAHDPYGKFRVTIVDANHPITRTLTDFETTDELYTCLAGATPITVLAQARSKVDGKPYPIAFVLDYGQGHVFHCVLGHDVKSLSVPAVGRLYRRACAWAAGLAVTAAEGSSKNREEPK